MSIMIPSAVSGTARAHGAAGVKEMTELQRAGAESPVRSRKPEMDEYVPEEKQGPSGRYWLGRDENGQPKIYFDDPERPDDDPSDASAPAEKSLGDKTESCTASTDQVDREIERLKKQKETLEQQINAQTDDTKIKALEQKLAQVKRELAQKDNNTYRRQHTVFS